MHERFFFAIHKPDVCEQVWNKRMLEFILSVTANESWNLYFLIRHTENILEQPLPGFGALMHRPSQHFLQQGHSKSCSQAGCCIAISPSVGCGHSLPSLTGGTQMVQAPSWQQRPPGPYFGRHSRPGPGSHRGNHIAGSPFSPSHQNTGTHHTATRQGPLE